MKTLRALLVLSLASPFCACTVVGPDYETPPVETPAVYSTYANADHFITAPADNAVLANWWELLDDPVLNKLVERAIEKSFTIQEAVERVLEARIRAGQVSGQLYPQLNARASYTRAGRIDGSSGGVATSNGFSASDDFFRASVDASWEIDLFGKIVRSEEAALASAEQTHEALRDTTVTLISDIASTYVQLRTLEQRMSAAEANSRIQRESLELAEARHQSGLVSRLDVTQANANLRSTQAAIPSLRAEIDVAKQRLGILIGGYPDAAEGIVESEDRGVPSIPEKLQLGAPAELLRRRADIRSAERELAAQSARIGVAEADFYPQLSLTGSIGVQASEAGDLFKSSSGVFSIGPSLTWKVFDAWQTEKAVLIEESRFRQAALRYQSYVRVAVQEVESAVTKLVEAQKERQELRAATEAAKESVDLAKAQYTEGLVSFQIVLDAERTLSNLENQLALSRGNVTSYAIALFKALGGGWENLELLEKPTE